MHGDQQTAGVRDDVGIGEKFIGTDQESGADTAAEATSFPWLAVVGNLGGGLDTDDRAVDALGLIELGGRGRGRGITQRCWRGRELRRKGKSKARESEKATEEGADGLDHRSEISGM